MKHFNDLTAAQDERLALLSEELAEAIQAIGKIQRHGYSSYNPTLPPDKQTDNRSLLEKELGHVWHAVNRMTLAGDLNWDIIDRAGRRQIKND